MCLYHLLPFGIQLWSYLSFGLPLWILFMCGYGYVYIGKVASSETENLKYFLGSSVIQERLRVQHFPLYFKKETTQRGLSI